MMIKITNIKRSIKQKNFLKKGEQKKKQKEKELKGKNEKKY